MLLIYIIIFYYICEVGIGGVWNFILFIKVFISSLYGVRNVYLLFVDMLLCEVLGMWIDCFYSECNGMYKYDWCLSVYVFF